jgi:hypothetical protein
MQVVSPAGKTPRKKIDVAWQFPAAVIEYLYERSAKNRMA